MGEQPRDPVSALTEGAIQQHEMFLAYIEAGFTHDEAIQLIVGLLAAYVNKDANGS